MNYRLVAPDPLVDEGTSPSLVESLFDDPDTVCEGEYTTIYEFLLDPDMRNDPEMIAGVLREFSGWALYMLKRMQELGLIERTGTYQNQ
jgi:hypothetical protein